MAGEGGEKRLTLSTHFYCSCVQLFQNQEAMSVAENEAEPYREFFVWSMLFSRMPLAMFFWKQCPDQLGSALVASLMLKSLASEAKLDGDLHLADELNCYARLVRLSSSAVGY